MKQIRGITQKKLLKVLIPVDLECCEDPNPPLTQIFTTDSDTISFSGTGTEEDPLTAFASESGGGNTIYSADGTIADVTRTVTLNSNLIFNSPIQGSFEIQMENADVNHTAGFNLRNGGGASGLDLFVENESQYLHLGQFGSELKGASANLNVGFNGGFLLRQGDVATKYAEIYAAPGTSTAPAFQEINSTAGTSAMVRVDADNTNPNAFIRAIASVSGIGTIAYSRITPTNYTVFKTVGGGDTTLFNVNIQTGVTTIPVLNNAAWISGGSGGVLVANAKIPHLDPTTATAGDIITALITAGLMA